MTTEQPCRSIDAPIATVQTTARIDRSNVAATPTRIAKESGKIAGWRIDYRRAAATLQFKGSSKCCIGRSNSIRLRDGYVLTNLKASF